MTHQIYKSIQLLIVACLFMVVFALSIALSDVQAKGASSRDGDSGVGSSPSGSERSISIGDDSGVPGVNAAGTIKGSVNLSSSPERPVPSSQAQPVNLSLRINGALEYTGTEPATYTLSWSGSASINGCRAAGASAGGKWSSPGGLYNLPRSGSQTLTGVAAGEYIHAIECRGSYVVQQVQDRGGGRQGGSLMEAFLSLDSRLLLAQADRGGGSEVQRVNFTATAWVLASITSSGLETPSVSLEVSPLEEETWTERIDIVPGAQVKLRWSSENATRCRGTEFSTTGRTSGTEENIAEPAGGERRYIIRCFNGPTDLHPSSTDFVTVSVLGGPEISAAPPLVNRCETTTILWNVHEVSGCTITGSDNQSFGPSVLVGEGSAVSQPICGQFTYTLSCPGLDGTQIRVRPRIHIEEI